MGGPLRIMVAGASLVILGAILGVTADRTLHRRHQATVAVIHRPLAVDDPVSVLDSVVHLSAAQRERVTAIFARRQPAIDAVWRDTHIRLRATLDSAVAELEAVLEPEQVQPFRRLVEALHNPRIVRPTH